MNPSLTMRAIVTDAFGARGGIAQYNRDFLRALAETGAVSSITVLPRHVPDISAPPERIGQTRARHGRIAYSVATLRTALFRPIDLVFCGHLFMASLAALIAPLKDAKLIVQTHGIEAWPRPSRFQRAALESADLVLCVSRYTRATVLFWATIAPERILVVPNTAQGSVHAGRRLDNARCSGSREQARALDRRANGLAPTIQRPRPNHCRHPLFCRARP